MRIVVGGSTGNTGKGVVQALANSGKGHTIIAVTRDPEGAVAKELSKLPGVIAKKEEDAFKEPVDRAYIASHNLRGQVIDETNFIILAHNAGVKYIVKLSTFTLFMDVYSPVYYGRTHLAVELLLQQGDIPFTCLRPNLFTNFFGIDPTNILEYRKFKAVAGDGNVAIIDPADVGKVAAALLLLDDPSPHYGKKYTLNGPEDVDPTKAKKILSEVYGGEFEYLGPVTNEDRIQPAKLWGYADKDFESLCKSFEMLGKGLGGLSHTSTSPEILSLSPPTTTLKDFLIRHSSKKV